VLSKYREKQLLASLFLSVFLSVHTEQFVAKKKNFMKYNALRFFKIFLNIQGSLNSEKNAFYFNEKKI